MQLNASRRLFEAWWVECDSRRTYRHWRKRPRSVVFAVSASLSGRWDGVGSVRTSTALLAMRRYMRKVSILVCVCMYVLYICMYGLYIWNVCMPFLLLIVIIYCITCWNAFNKHTTTAQGIVALTAGSTSRPTPVWWPQPRVVAGASALQAWVPLNLTPWRLWGPG